MRWLANFYNFKFKWTAREAIGIHPTKAWFSQLVNFKNPIWTWGHFRRTICSKTAEETYGMLQTAFEPSCMNRRWVFEWHKRFKEARESVRGDESCGRSKEVNRPELISQTVRVRVGGRKRPALFKSGQWHFQQDNAPVHNSILVTDYLTKMGIKTVPYPPYCPDFSPCDFCLFPRLRGCRYETIEEVKEAVTKVIDTITEEDFHGAF